MWLSYESEKITSRLGPAKLYEGLVKKSVIVLSKLDPAIEGNGGPGSIIKITLLVDGKSKYALRKVEEVEEEGRLVYKYSMVGGDVLPEYVEKICYQDSLVEAPNGGGTIATIIMTYHTKGDASPPHDEINKGQFKAQRFLRALEAYLLAN